MNKVIVSALAFLLVSCSAPTSKQASPTATPSPIETPSYVRPTPEETLPSLRESAPRPTPGDAAIDTASGHRWVEHSNVIATYRIPYGWWDESDSEEISATYEDGLIAVQWMANEELPIWFYADNEHGTYVQNMAAEYENAMLDAFSDLGEVVMFTRLPQDALGSRMVVGATVHEFTLRGEWSDAEELHVMSAITECGQYRMCFFHAEKIDQPITDDDWSAFAYFATHIEFAEDD